MLFLLGSIWALPITLIGFVMACLGWAYPAEFERGIWRWIAAPFGPFHWFFTFFRFGALTLGNVQVYANRRTLESPEAKLHENQHTIQTHILGPFFPPLYLAASVNSSVCGTGFYEGNCFEQAARRASEQ